MRVATVGQGFALDWAGEQIREAVFGRWARTGAASGSARFLARVAERQEGRLHRQMGAQAGPSGMAEYSSAAINWATCSMLTPWRAAGLRFRR